MAEKDKTAVQSPHCLYCRLGLQEYGSALGALTSLANLQAIAAMQGAANLASASGAATLGGNLDMASRQNLAGLGGFGSNPGASTLSALQGCHMLMCFLRLWCVGVLLRFGVIRATLDACGAGACLLFMPDRV